MNEKKSVKNEKKKKKKAEPEIGYCPLSMRPGAGQGAQAHRRAGHAGAQAGRAGRWALGRRGERGGRHAGADGRVGSATGKRAGRPAMRGLDMLLGQQAVHSVNSACFDPISTQYCS